MIYGAPHDTASNDYPPGHPAGTDEFISAGEVLSGRGTGTDAVLGVDVGFSAESMCAVDAPAAATGKTGPTVLIAVDGTATSERVVRDAHRLFGEDAAYLAINVGKGPYTQMSWAYVWPVAEPAALVSRDWAADTINGAVDTGTDQAALEAEAVAHHAGLAQVSPIGDVGDPTSAILRAAHHHHADVVVIGADARSWLSHLFDGSVERELLNEADFAVLVVDVGLRVARP